MSTAREVALRCLSSCEKSGAWSDGFLKNAIRQAGLDSRDAALCTRLSFGVLQNKLLLNWYLERFSNTPPERMQTDVRNILYLGIYQLLYLTKVPSHAAVSESVELARTHSRNAKVPGMVNGILRAVDRQRDELPQPETLSVRYSHPEWLVREFKKALGKKDVEALLAADNEQPPTTVQVNTLKTTAAALTEELKQAGAALEPHPWLPDCLLLTGAGSLEQLPAFREGRFYVQDAAARLSVLAADPRPGMAVLDVCAAPGGKSFAAAVAMGDAGSVLSCDIHPHKRALIESGARRLGISCVKARTMDARERQVEFLDSFDLVIADVPCSGLGVIRKKPDIRYKDPLPLRALPEIQRAILENVCAYVRPGGVVLYSTCTILRRENEDVVTAFLDNHPDFTLEPFILPGPAGESGGMTTLWPHLHGTDGFFMAKLRRK